MLSLFLDQLYSYFSKVFRKLFIILIFFIGYNSSIGQNLSGKVTDHNNQILPGSNIVIKETLDGTSTDKNGIYNLKIPPNRSIVIEVSFIGFYSEKIRIPMLKQGQVYSLNIQLNPKNKIINDVIVSDKESRKKSLSRIKTKHVTLIPGSNSDIETILKTLPGVSSANELSSQYSVRGGNFDENLVYVNGIEIYRPFLIHSGQQEGLSFINPNLVSNIEFSAGGFEAKYGDKMSSVLDITYKKPIEHKASIQSSLLGGSLHMEGIMLNNRLTYIMGARHKRNQYLLNSLDTRAEYNPQFSDFQTFINYRLKDNWNISFLGSISENKYQMIPENRDTEFGTLNEALKLRIYFEGQESDKYNTYFGAINTSILPNLKTELNFTLSAFQTIENESYDILGEYWLYQLENNLGSDNFGDVKFDRGVGKFIDHARNNLEARVINISHHGHLKTDKNTKIEWGINLKKEDINDNIREWTLIDSAGFTLPHPNDNIGDSLNTNQEILMSRFEKSETNLSSFRPASYLQFNKDIGNFSLNSGIRSSYWTINNELILSPRINIAFIPLWEKDIIFRGATGIYYQAPFYKEIRSLTESIRSKIKSQKATHFLIGSDYLFYKWGRPFKFISEIYYKNLENLIPYKVDNVRIEYLPEQTSNGYATGIDLKINGEFVTGIESWASLSVMQTKEDIENDSYENDEGNTIYPGFIPRPTDQRVNFSMFFQDYIPKNPNYKMPLNLIYGTGLPFGPPESEKHQDILRIPDYRRVDIGFSAVLKNENKFGNIKWLNYFKSIWLSAEVFNLIDIDNTVSYLWVSDVNGRQYAVPNYLTSRQLNFKLIINL